MFLASLFLSIGFAVAQTQVSGTVISSEDNEPIIGASIIVQGSKVGTVTDADGKFSLSVPMVRKLSSATLECKLRRLILRRT